MSYDVVFRRKDRTGDGTKGFGHLSNRPLTKRVPVKQ